MVENSNMYILIPYRIFALNYFLGFPSSGYILAIVNKVKCVMGEILKKRLKQEKFSSIEQETLLNLFIASNYLHLKLEEVCSEFNITLAQFNVLRILNGVHPEGHPRGEIIRRMVEPAPDVTRLIDRLIKGGLVERYSSKDDRRLSLARITKKGINLLNKVNPEVDKFIFDYSSSLTKSEKENLSRICEKLYAVEVKN